VIAEVMTSHKRLELQAKKFRESQRRLRDQARQALLSGREDQAKISLTRAHAATAQLVSLELQVAILRGQEARLEMASQRLTARVEGFRSQMAVFRAQYSAARASAHIGESLAGMSREMGDVGRMLETVRKRTREIRARVAAIDDPVAPPVPLPLAKAERRRSASREPPRDERPLGRSPGRCGPQVPRTLKRPLC
jgi:phage shock protein A